MNKSIQLLRTNPRLTTNIKLVVSSDYTLYYESFNSSKELSDDMFKHYLLNRESTIEDDLPLFYSGIPKKIAFTPKSENDTDVMYDKYINQYDNTYFSGADEVEDQWYGEEFEYFAPLYINKNNIPENFIIFRVDDPSVYEIKNGEYVLGNLSKDNFREEVINKWKCVNVFDLSNNTNLGKYIDRNIKYNDRFPEYSFFFDTKKYNFSKWSGIDYNTGVYTTSEMFLDDKLFYENPHYNFEEFITKGYEDNSIVHPYIMNIKFLFDDDPATPDEFNKYSMNRYYGFYSDNLELVESLTSYDFPDLKDNLRVKNNIFLDTNGNYINPFVNETTKLNWVEVNNEYYEVRQTSSGIYKIISDKILDGYNFGGIVEDLKLDTANYLMDKYNNFVNPFKYGKDVADGTSYRSIVINNEYYTVDYNNGKYQVLNLPDGLESYDILTVNNGVCIINYNNDKTIISGINDIDVYISSNGTIENMYADIYLIEINGVYHILKEEDGEYYIESDYAINTNKETIQYWKGGVDSKYFTELNIINEDGSPLAYKIYRVKLTDISDFDFDRIDTKYSDFDYEKSEYVETPEVKLYATEYRDNSIPKRKKTHNNGEDGQYKLKNISSEYISNDELFQLKKDKLLSMWDKNQSVCKWHYNGSISHCDYPYKLNNSLEHGGVYNRTTNTSLKKSNVTEKTLDYFYRIGDFYGEGVHNFINEINENIIHEWSGNISVDGANTWNYVTSESELKVNVSDSEDTITYNEKLNSRGVYKINIKGRIVSVNGTTVFNLGSTFPDVSVSSSTVENFEIDVLSIALNDTFQMYATSGMLEIYEITVSELENKYYFNQTTNIQTSLLSSYDNIVDSRFNLNRYISTDVDYFEYFFNNIMYYENYGQVLKKPYTKYSYFSGGDSSLPTTTLFKGIEYKLHGITDMVLNPAVGTDTTIRNIITNGGDDFNNYKFSVILNENYENYNPKTGTVSYSNNTINGSSSILLDSDKNGIHIFMNKKFKNILIIINNKFSIDTEYNTINNTDFFGENFGLYNGTLLDGSDMTTNPDKKYIYDPDKLTAAYYIETLNNMNTKNVYEEYVSYYVTDEEGVFSRTKMVNFKQSTMTDLTSWDNIFPPFYIEVDVPSDIQMKNKSYDYESIVGPETNIYDKYLVYSNKLPLSQSIIDEPLSRSININEVDTTKNIIVNGEKISNTKLIKRYDGYYEPLLNIIPMYKPTYYWYLNDNNNNPVYHYMSGNYVFSDDIDQFGQIRELMYSKVNDEGNYLKLKDSDTERSYYPMVDEIGLSQTNKFIFSSTWDNDFYIKTLNEQTFLEDYIEVPEQIITVDLFGVIDSVSIINGGDNVGNIYNGDEVHGYNMSYELGNNTYFNYVVGITNPSEIAIEYDLIFFLISSHGNIEKTHTKVYVGAGSYKSFNITCDKAPESTGIPYEKYTTWTTRIDLISPLGDFLDSNSSMFYNVYNNNIHVTFNNMHIDGGWDGTHITGTEYSVNGNIVETNNKISNAMVDTYMLVDNGIGEFIEQSSTTVIFDINTKIVEFDFIADRDELNIDSSEEVMRDVMFVSKYAYFADGRQNFITTNYLSPNKISIRGEEDSPNIIWDSSYNVRVARSSGSCSFSGNTGVYTGDQFTSIFQFINTGGTFTGTITASGKIYGNDYHITTLTLNGASWSGTLENNETATITMVSPRIYTNANPHISYDYVDYKLSAQSSSISNGTVKYSSEIAGVRPTGFTCPNKTIVSTPTPDDEFGTTPTTGGGTCLDENTMIRLANGTEKKIKHLAVGEKLKSYKVSDDTTENWEGNANLGEVTYSTLINKQHLTTKGYHVINYGLIKCTSTHVILVRDFDGVWKWMTADKIKVGHYLFNMNKLPIIVSDNTFLDISLNIVLIDVDNTDNYFASDVLMHNKESIKESNDYRLNQ